MPNLEKFFLIFLFVYVFCPGIKAQNPTPDQRRERLEEQRQQRQVEERRNMDMERERRLRDYTIPIVAKPLPRPKSISLSKEDKAKFKEILMPAAQDLEKYKNFLRQSNAGLFRLFPDSDCQVSKNLIRADGNCANLVPGTWNYSFRRRDYLQSDFWDIRFKDGNLISKGFLSQGILVKLGDTPLENISSVSGGMKFLFDFKPAEQIEAVKNQFAQFTRGVEVNAYKYTNSVKAVENMTYALRVIAYRNQDKTLFRLAPDKNADDIEFAHSYFDKRVDLIVVFRIVKRDEDGNITILWKELKRESAPKIIFKKNDKLSDIKTVTEKQ